MHRLIPYIFLILFNLPGLLQAQIFRGNASGSDLLTFQIHTHSDSLFVFDPDSSNMFLNAFSTDGDTAIITVGYFNPGSLDFTDSDPDTAISVQIPVISDQGYRVIIQAEAATDTFHCWAVIDSFTVRITSGEYDEIDGEMVYKIPDGSAYKGCHLIKGLEAEFQNTSMHYYHWENGSSYDVRWNTINVSNNWSSSDSLDGYDLIVGYAPYTYVDIEKPSYNDVWYHFTVKDRFGIVAQDSIYNESIEPHASFTFKYIPRDNAEYYPNGIEDQERRDQIYGDSGDDYSAPAVYLFTNKSKNFKNMIWHLGDTSITITSDTAIAEANDTLIYTYKLPGTYYPRLIVFNELDYLYDACADSMPGPDGEYTTPEQSPGDTNSVGDDYPIKIEEANILGGDGNGLPNVMTCGDGSSPNSNFFRFLGDVSIGQFHIRIFNRYGKMVYEYSGEMTQWEGWDGTVMNSDGYVRTGVYYYVVKKFEMLPDYETGRVPNLFVERPNSGGGETGTKSNFADTPGTTGGGIGGNSSIQSTDGKTNNILRGFFHVYNTER